MRCDAIPHEVPVPGLIQADMDGLERRRRVAAVELEKVVAERAALARAAAGNDKLVQARIEWLNVRHAELAGELDLLETRQGIVGERLGAVLEAQQLGRLARQPDPRATARALLAASRRADAALAAVATALVARAVLARRLAGLGKGHARLVTQTRVLAAAAHAGLGDFLGLAPSPVRLHGRLADADKLALRSLIEPTAKGRPA